MDNSDLITAVAVALGSGVAAEIVRRIIPGTKHDSKAVAWLGTISKILTLGGTSFLKGDGKLKP